MVRAIIREDRREQEVEKITRMTKLPAKEVKMVIDAIIADRENNKRQPKPPAPERGISLMAAERKYGINHGTLSRWGKRGLVPVLLRTRNETYLDEVALVTLINAYKQNSGQGKWTIKQIANAS